MAESDQIQKAADTAGRYAHAAAKKGTSLDGVINDVGTLQAMVTSTEGLNELLISESRPRTAKVDALPGSLKGRHTLSRGSKLTAGTEEASKGSSTRLLRMRMGTSFVHKEDQATILSDRLMQN